MNKIPDLPFHFKPKQRTAEPSERKQNKAKQNAMATITVANAPILRYYRCSHGRRLVILLMCLSCYSLGWIATRLVASSPTSTNNILFEVQQQKPRNNNTSTRTRSPPVAAFASIHDDRTALFRNCLGGASSSTNCGAINGTANTAGTTSFQDPIATNANANTSTAPSAATGHYYRHPNFTFDFPLCLVHVGKTAGSTISCGLGLMYANCGKFEGTNTRRDGIG